ncbi:hypothetical protein D0868_09634 [Hortaea werneckii]|uniref:Elongator complex protein 1 n=1 Tax=Hortaea werneckii TaxID=91943 RepID=A0A3M6Y899_HORWE|nr:hypothetical protein D0868_09634 [Hortaea werneckii]
MRNLRNTQSTSIKFTEPAALTAICHDLDGIICAFGPSESSPSISLKRVPPEATDAEESIALASWDAQATDQILDLHSFADTQTICVVLAHGDIVVIRTEPQPGEELVEIVGTVDDGISAAAWSPDEELLALATTAGTFLLMTKDFDPTANVTLSPDDVKVSNHVSVGWGKKETQFKGRGAAKALRDPTVPEHIDEGILSPLDDGKVSISWRGDGQYVATNTILEAEPRRRILRVYNREGVLESVSEPVNGLEGALSWKPSGQLLACVQRKDDGCLRNVFFERNGLRHGEFDLRLSKEEAETSGRHVSLSWNTDSTVLAVILTDRVQLWTMGNYHYYLKQELRFGTNMLSRSLTAAWSSEKSLQISCSNGEELRMLNYSLAVSRGHVLPPLDTGLVAVIDGKILKITPLRFANVPPPMALDEVELPEAIDDVWFSPDGREIIVKHGTHVSIYACDYASKPMMRATLRDTKLLGQAEDEQSTEVTRMGEEGFSLSENGALRKQGKPLPIRCTSFVATSSHLIFTTTNHLLKFVHLADDEDLQIPPDEPEKDERCRNVERGAKIVTVIPSTFALILQMPRGNLETIYPRALVLAGVRNCIVNRDYKKAFMICRSHRVDMNILHDYAPEQFMQDIELFIKQVKKTEHIDLFLSSVSEENVAETMYKETLTTKLDKPLSKGAAEEAATKQSGSVSKVNKICDAFLTALQEKRSSHLQNIVTAHVCKSPPDLEAGLMLVSELRKQQDQEALESAVEHICFLADVNQLYDTALGIYDLDVALLVAQQSQKDPREYLPYLQGLHDMQPLRQRFGIDNDLRRYQKALSHLHALGDFDDVKQYTIKHELYSTAITLYRYDGAKTAELMRLYADHLNSRNRYKEAGIAYEFVQDYASAYEVYRAASLWQECLGAAELIPLPEEEMTTLAGDLAAALEEAKNFPAAATVHLEYLHDLETAATLLCKGYQFSEATRIVAKHKRPELLKSVVDPGLIEASASMTEMLAEMRTQVNAQVPRLRELREKKAEDPMAFIDGGVDAPDADVPDDISLVTTNASTTGTFMTRYTNRSTGTLATNATRKTSKNRRREERKRAKGKKGTVYEEEYLVNSIARLIERLNSIASDLTTLVESLMRRAMRERAVAVETAAQEVFQACNTHLSEVFSQGASNAPPAPANGNMDGDASRPWGGEGVLWEAMEASGQQRTAPVLKAFERLSLLS